MESQARNSLYSVKSQRDEVEQNVERLRHEYRATLDELSRADVSRDTVARGMSMWLLDAYPASIEAERARLSEIDARLDKARGHCERKINERKLVEIIHDRKVCEIEFEENKKEENHVADLVLAARGQGPAGEGA